MYTQVWCLQFLGRGKNRPVTPANVLAGGGGEGGGAEGGEEEGKEGRQKNINESGRHSAQNWPGRQKGRIPP